MVEVQALRCVHGISLLIADFHVSSHSPLVGMYLYVVASCIRDGWQNREATPATGWICRIAAFSAFPLFPFAMSDRLTRVIQLPLHGAVHKQS